MIRRPSHFDNAADGADNEAPVEAKLAVLADGANVTDGGKLNLLGVFDQVYTNKFPTVHPQMYVVVRLAASPAEFGRKKEFEIILLDEDGQTLGSVKAKAEVPRPIGARSATVEMILRMVNVPFPKAGRYAFSVLVSGEEKASIPLDVVERKTTTRKPRKKRG